MFYLKNIHKKHFYLDSLCKKCKTDPRNPAEPYCRTGRPLGTNIPLYYVTYESPYQHSCWEISKKSKDRHDYLFLTKVQLKKF